MIKYSILTLLLLLVITGSSPAQEIDDIVRPFFGYSNSQSLITAIGNATVASGQVIPGLTSNPANLGLSRFNSVQSTFMAGNYERGSANSSQTEFGGFYSISPVPVYRGSLVFGFGIQKTVDFSKAWELQNSSFSEEGSLYTTDLSMAVEFSQDFFVGAALSYLQGEDEALRTDGINSSILTPKYKGLGLSVGFVNRISSIAQVGASVNFPTLMWVSEKYTVWEDSAPEQEISETREYLLKRPLQFHVGGAILLRWINLFYELEWSNWQDLTFDSDEYFQGDISDINGEINEQLTSTTTHHLGAAIHPDWMPVHLYLGYQYMPTVFNEGYKDDLRQSVSIGSAYMLNQQFSVHGSFTNYFAEYYGEDESFKQLIFGATIHF